VQVPPVTQVVSEAGHDAAHPFGVHWKAEPMQRTPQAVQLLVVVRLVSQPFVASPSQSPQPLSH
jgi:hypothetical protein